MVENFMSKENSTLDSISEDAVNQKTVTKIGESIVEKYEDPNNEKLHKICTQYESIFQKETEPNNNLVILATFMFKI